MLICMPMKVEQKDGSEPLVIGVAVVCDKSDGNK